MTHENLVADELNRSGFRTKVIASNSVMVSLSKRKVCAMEVETALENIFDGIAFNCASTNRGVLVTF